MRSASRVRIRVALLRGHRRAAGEERRVVAGRELLGLAQHLLERRPLPERARAAVMERGARPSSARGRPSRGRRSRSARAPVISSAGEMRIAPFSPMPGALLQHPREAADAVAAVALAGDEDGRAPAAVLGEPAAHELAQRLEVALVAEVLLRVRRVVRLAPPSLPSPFFSVSMMRLKPVPTGSTNTRSVNASHDDSFSTSRGGIAGSVPSDGKSTRCGPTAPMCRYADDAPGPAVEDERHGPVAIAVRRRRTRRRRSRPRASPSCAGRSTSPVAVYSIGLAAAPPRRRGLGALRAARGRASLSFCLVLRLVAHGRARYRLLRTPR